MSYNESLPQYEGQEADKQPKGRNLAANCLDTVSPQTYNPETLVRQARGGLRPQLPTFFIY